MTKLKNLSVRHVPSHVAMATETNLKALTLYGLRSSVYMYNTFSDLVLVFWMMYR